MKNLTTEFAPLTIDLIPSLIGKTIEWYSKSYNKKSGITNIIKDISGVVKSHYVSGKSALSYCYETNGILTNGDSDYFVFFKIIDNKVSEATTTTDKGTIVKVIPLNLMSI